MSKRIMLYNDLLKIDIPDFMTEMNDEDIKKIFCQSKPDKAFAYEEKNVYVSAQQTETNLQDCDIEKRLIEYYRGYERAVPNFASGSAKMRTLDNGKTLGMISYLSTSIKFNLFNYVFLMSIDGKETILSLNCKEQMDGDLMIDLMKMVDSIEVY